MGTKIWLWSLVTWKKVVYYDSDMFFLKPPWECAAECPDDADLCAVADPLGALLQGHKADYNYINAGFLILKPSRQTFRWLKANVKRAYHRRFPDQDMLNEMFHNNIYTLPKKCNFLHSATDYRGIASSKDVVAVHEKMREMKGMIPQDHFLRRCIHIPN